MQKHVQQLAVVDDGRCVSAEIRVYDKRLFASSRPLPAGRQGRALGDLEQPRRRRIAGANAPSPLGQDEKRRLEGIFHILMVSQDLATNHPNQPSMPLHNLSKRTIIPLPDELHQQLAIRGHDRARPFPRRRN